MKPYYQDKWVTIYNGDCREILPKLDVKVDLVLTDPPYINLKGGICRNIGTNNPRNNSVGDLWSANLDWIPLLNTKGAIVFCSFSNLCPIVNAFGNDKLIGIATWLIRNSAPPIRNVPLYNTQYILYFKNDIGLIWHGLPTFYDIPTLNHISNERIKDNEGISIHPTQKPVSLISIIANITEGTILDPFLGSGTTCYCAKKLNRYSIGIEIEEKYCEIAAKRCSQEVMELNI
jgi:site-specific DNA-methyltransferase (adenine-specific)